MPNLALPLLRVRQPSLANIGCRVEDRFSTRLCRLLDRRKSGAFTGWAFDFPWVLVHVFSKFTSLE